MKTKDRTTERQRVKLQRQLAWREAREGGEHMLEIVSESAALSRVNSAE